MTAIESGANVRPWIIFCEGFHDRDFLSGFFARALEFESLERDNKAPGFEWTRGAHGWRRGANVVSIIPCEGESSDSPEAANTRKAYRERVKSLPVKPAAGLVLCLDEDVGNDADDLPCDEARQRARQRVADIAREAASGERFDPAQSILHVDGSGVHLLPVTWCTDVLVSTHVPPRPNLERLVVAACCEAYPERGRLVHEWLESRGDDRPAGLSARDKAYSWSHMAGWFPSPGGASFFRSLWNQYPTIKAALLRRMAETGIDRLLDAMAVAPPWKSVGRADQIEKPLHH